MAKWMACVPNISEGRRRDVIDAVAAAARDVANVYVQHVDSDPDHNRTVLTLTGAPPAVADAAFRVVREAATRIDMRAHEGEHPRLGAADVVPFVPLSGVTLSDCARVAGRLAEWIEAELGIPAYLYGAAAPDGAALPEVRKRADRRHETAGATAVGAREALIAFNVNLDGDDLDAAKRIARQVRERDGGLPAVRALGFRLKSRGLVQVSMNLVDYRRTSPLRAYREVERLAAEHGLAIRESEVVGMVPREAVEAGFVDATRCARLAVIDTQPSFLDALAATDPVPAGASAAAFAGAMAAALTAMAAGILHRREQEPRMEQVRARAQELRRSLRALVDRDAEAYRAFLADPAPETARGAILAPLEVAERAGEVGRLADEVLEHAFAGLRTDCRGAVRLANVAYEQAAETVRVNLRQSKDETFAAEIRDRLARIREP